MPKKSDFKNPLFQPTPKAGTDTSTEVPTETETFTPTLPSTKSETYTSTSVPTTPQVQHRKRGAQAFEKTHERITLWVDKGLRAQFEALAEKQGISKTQLLNEAISDLLEKHRR